MFDKPKRKRKEKLKRGEKLMWWPIAFPLFLLLIVGLILLYLVAQSLGDHSLDAIAVSGCEFESNPSMFVQGREESYVTDLEGTTRIDVPQDFRIPVWVIDHPYMWATNSNATTTLAVNLDQSKLLEFTSPTYLFAIQYYSPSLRYFAGLGEYKQNNPNTRYFIIFDAETETTVFESSTYVTHVLWSTDETSVLLFNGNNQADSHLFDLPSSTLILIDLPSDLGQPIGWLDNEHVIYLTRANRLRVWNVTTGDTTAYADELFGNFYQAGGKEKGFNVQFDMPQRRWISGITATGEVHLYNVYDDRHLAFSIDRSQEFNYRTYNHFVHFDYKSDANPRHHKIYYVDTETLVDFKPAMDADPQFSLDGRFVFYLASGGLAESPIQNVITGETMTLGASTVTDMDWTTIDGQSYLIYAVPRGDGANMYYLVNPDTKEHCGLGSYFAYDLQIQPKDWMR